ncbi:hypothetical protein ACNFJN_06575 [Xenorhabdus budapestensis]|uniref:hypothetical protein n=1 Tax=Xenorhabdus budapestensis TaxID=290110 RepID=UPI003A899B2F
MEIKEKIAFSFSSIIPKNHEDIATPIIIRMVPNDIDFLDFEFNFGVTIGFVGLIKNLRYIYKVFVYKDGKSVFCSPNADAGFVFESESNIVENERISATTTDQVAIIAEPENGIYELKILLCKSGESGDIVLDEMSSFFEVIVISK